MLSFQTSAIYRTSQIARAITKSGIQSLFHPRQGVYHMVREVEDGKSKWGTKLNEDWKELGFKSIGGWCSNVKDRGWLASKLGASKKKRKGKKKEDSRT